MIHICSGGIFTAVSQCGDVGVEVAAGENSKQVHIKLKGHSTIHFASINPLEKRREQRGGAGTEEKEEREQEDKKYLRLKYQV